MPFVGLSERIALANDVCDYVYAGAAGLLVAFAVLSFCFSSFRVMMHGGVGEFGQYFVRVLFVVAIFAGYHPLVKFLVSVSEDLTAFFAERAGWSEYWDRVAQESQTMLAGRETSEFDRLIGWMKGGVLTIAVSVSFYLEFLVFELVRHLTAVFAGILYVLGPLMIAGGVIGNGRSLQQWCMAFLQVMLWPCVPPLLMLFIVGAAGNAVETGNVSFIVSQNLILVFLGLLTPAIVMFVIGPCGIASFATGLIGIATSTISSLPRRISGAGGSGGYVHEHSNSSVSGGFSVAPSYGASENDSSKASIANDRPDSRAINIAPSSTKPHDEAHVASLRNVDGSGST